MLRSIQSCILAAIWRALGSLGGWLQGERDVESVRSLGRALVADGRDLERLADELEEALSTGGKEQFNAGEGW